MSATATATSVQELDKQVNDDVLSGKAMEAFEKYYADDVVMQENSEEPRSGKAANRKAEEEFFASVEALERRQREGERREWRCQLLRMGDGHHVQGRTSREDEPGSGAEVEERQDCARAVFLQQGLKAPLTRAEGSYNKS